jgi:hypothetical protein
VASYVRTHLVLLAFAPGLVSGHPLASASCVVSIILTALLLWRFYVTVKSYFSESKRKRGGKPIMVKVEIDTDIYEALEKLILEPR